MPQPNLNSNQVSATIFKKVVVQERCVDLHTHVVPAKPHPMGRTAAVDQIRTPQPTIPNPQLDLPDNKLKLTTPIKPNKLFQYLQFVPPSLAEFVQKGFTEGFRIQYQGPPQFRISRNHSSTLQQPEIVMKAINKELCLNRVAGPFDQPPFPHYVSSPLGIIPKKTPGEHRLIHDLSYPPDTSINSFIPKSECSVSYETLDTIIALVHKSGRGSFIAKADIEAAFRIIPINPLDHHLLGFTWTVEGVTKYFYDKCLPFGCSISCRTFENFSCSLQHILINHFEMQGVSHILDDFMFVHAAKLICQRNLDLFFSFCDEIGIPVNKSKTCLPATVSIVHGIEIDTVKMELRMPLEKVEKIKMALQEMHRKRSTTLKEMQKLTGLLNFATIAVAPGRAFLRRLYDLTCRVQRPSHHLNLNSEARADLKAWYTFIQEYNGRSLFLHEYWISSKQLHLYTDAASTVGLAAVWGKKWFFAQFPDSWSQLSISLLELIPIVIAVEVWGTNWRNHCVLFHSDNTGAVDIINKQTSKNSQIMIMVRRFVLACMKYNILFHAAHIRGSKNVTADLISRFKLQEAREIYPQLDLLPTNLPETLLPWHIQKPC